MCGYRGYLLTIYSLQANNFLRRRGVINVEKKIFVFFYYDLLVYLPTEFD